MAVNINPAIHAHLTDMSDAEIAQAADRWKAFERIAGRFVHHVGVDQFAPTQIAGIVRSLDEYPGWSGMFETLAASKLTELADLVRAKSLEDAIERANQS